MATLRFYDEFSSADNADINGSVPSNNGSSWSKVYNTSTPYMRDGSGGFAGQGYPNTTSSNNGYMYAALISGSYENDQDAEAALTTMVSTLGIRSNLFVRRQDDSNFILVGINVTNAILNIRVSGTSTMTTISGGWANNDVAKLSVVGTTVTLYKNGSSVYSASHTVPSSGTPGCGAGTSPGWASDTQNINSGYQRFAYFKAYDEPPAASFSPDSFGISGRINGNLGGRL